MEGSAVLSGDPGFRKKEGGVLKATKKRKSKQSVHAKHMGDVDKNMNEWRSEEVGGKIHPSSQQTVHEL